MLNFKSAAILDANCAEINASESLFPCCFYITVKTIWFLRKWICACS